MDIFDNITERKTDVFDKISTPDIFDKISSSKTFGQKAVEFLTGEHITFDKEPPPEVDISPEGKTTINVPKTADTGFFQDPVTWAAMAAYKPVQMVGSSVGKKALAAGREFVGWMTGGVSEVPALTKSGVELVAEGISARNKASRFAKNIKKGIFETVPGAKIPTGNITKQTAQTASKIDVFDEITKLDRGSLREPPSSVSSADVSKVPGQASAPTAAKPTEPTLLEAPRTIIPDKEGVSGLEKLALEQKIVGQEGSIKIGGKSIPEAKIKFDNPDIESRFKTSEKLPIPTLTQKIKGGLDTIWTKFSREFEYIPKNKEFAQLRFDLLKLQKQKDVAKDTAIKSIGEITSGFDKSSYEIFRRKVILDDLANEARQGKELPYGFTPDILRIEKQKIDVLASSNEKITQSLSARKATWDTIKTEYIKSMKEIGFDVSKKFGNEDYFRHQVLEYANIQGIFGTGKKLKTPTGSGFLKQRKGSVKDISSDYLGTEYQVMSQMFHDIEVANTIKNVDKNYNIKKQIMEIAKSKKLTDWKDAIPEGFTTWQPREGNLFFMADSVPQKLSKDIAEGIITDVAEIPEKLRPILAIGKSRNEWVVKQEIADTLDNLIRQKAPGILADADKTIMRGWKQWQLIQPRRFFKYNIRNLSGDAESVFIGNPSAFQKTPQAVEELWDVYINKKQMTPEMQEWFNRGGMSSTLQAAEMGDMKSLWMFQKLYSKNNKVSELPGKLWAKYWNAAQLSTNAREGVLRYSAYLDYLEQMTKNNGTPKNFGASKPEEIMGLSDIRDRAYWLSNDLLGAYDRVSVAGQSIREHLIPFWSWQEVNMGRYKQLFSNAANDGKTLSIIGKTLGAKTPMAVFKVGKLVAKVSAFVAATQVYNHTLFPDEEKELPPEVKGKPHIILGRDKDGKINYFSRLGTLGDALDWMGVDGVQKEVHQYLNGYQSLKDTAKGMAKEFTLGPINVIQKSSVPLLKLAFETGLQRSAYPDISKPSTIRDRGLYIARSFGMENEYKAITGKPAEKYTKSIPKLFYYDVDPLENSYRDTFDMKRDFLKKIGKESTGFWLTPKGDALYNMKLSLRYQDKDAFTKYSIEYLSRGGKPDGIQKSLESMHPLSGMNEQEKNAFVSSLTKEDQDKVGGAIRFYNTTLLGIKNDHIQ